MRLSIECSSIQTWPLRLRRPAPPPQGLCTPRNPRHSGAAPANSLRSVPAGLRIVRCALSAPVRVLTSSGCRRSPQTARASGSPDATSQWATSPHAVGPEGRGEGACSGDAMIRDMQRIVAPSGWLAGWLIGWEGGKSGEWGRGTSNLAGHFEAMVWVSGTGWLAHRSGRRRRRRMGGGGGE